MYGEMVANQDDCLIAISEGKQIPADKLRALHPWRAVLIARVGRKAGLGISDGTTLEGLVSEATMVGGAGKLKQTEW